VFFIIFLMILEVSQKHMNIHKNWWTFASATPTNGGASSTKRIQKHMNRIGNSYKQQNQESYGLKPPPWSERKQTTYSGDWSTTVNHQHITGVKNVTWNAGNEIRVYLLR
jgi:hypothetical protein